MTRPSCVSLCAVLLAGAGVVGESGCAGTRDDSDDSVSMSQFALSTTVTRTLDCQFVRPSGPPPAGGVTYTCMATNNVGQNFSCTGITGCSLSVTGDFESSVTVWSPSTPEREQVALSLRILALGPLQVPLRVFSRLATLVAQPVTEDIRANSAQIRWATRAGEALPLLRYRAASGEGSYRWAAGDRACDGDVCTNLVRLNDLRPSTEYQLLFADLRSPITRVFTSASPAAASPAPTTGGVTCAFIGGSSVDYDCYATDRYGIGTRCSGNTQCSMVPAPATPEQRVLEVWSPSSKWKLVLPRDGVVHKVELPVYPRTAVKTGDLLISGAGENAMSIRWSSDGSAVPALRVYQSADPGQGPVSAQVHYGQRICTGSNCSYDVTVYGLTPGAKYHVRANDLRVPMIGEYYCPLRFGAFGDVQGDSASVLGGVTNAILARSPSICLQTGDIGSSSSDWATFSTRAQMLLDECPLYSSVGNSDDDALWLSNLTFEPRPNAGALYYAFTYGNTRFLAFHVDGASAPDATQQDWFAQQMAASATESASNIVLFLHSGPFGKSETRDPNTAFATWLGDRLTVDSDTTLFGKLRVVLSGHQHVYARFAKSYTRGSTTTVIPFIVVGTAGADNRRLATSGNPDLMASSGNGPTDRGLVLTVRGTQLTGMAVDPTGLEVDAF